MSRRRNSKSQETKEVSKADETTATATATASATTTTTTTSTLFTPSFLKLFNNMDDIFKTFYFRQVFLMLGLNDREKMTLRFQCSIFKQAIPPPPLWTIFPNHNPKSKLVHFQTLKQLLHHLNVLGFDHQRKVPTLILIGEGEFNEQQQQQQQNKGADSVYMPLNFPMTIIGEGADKTVLLGGIMIDWFKMKRELRWQSEKSFRKGAAAKEQEGAKEGAKEGSTKSTMVSLTGRIKIMNLSISHSKQSGIFCNTFSEDTDTFPGFQLENVCIDSAAKYGIVIATSTNGICVNTQISDCQRSGIMVSDGGSIDLFGNDTKVSSNCLCNKKRDFGLRVYDSDSAINIHSPLTTEIVALDNQGGGNVGGYGHVLLHT